MNGKEANFAVDTGADVTVMSRRCLKECGVTGKLGAPTRALKNADGSRIRVLGEMVHFGEKGFYGGPGVGCRGCLQESAGGS